MYIIYIKDIYIYIYIFKSTSDTNIIHKQQHIQKTKQNYEIKKFGADFPESIRFS